jgi:hypothetical protein
LNIPVHITCHATVGEGSFGFENPSITGDHIRRIKDSNGMLVDTSGTVMPGESNNRAATILKFSSNGQDDSDNTASYASKPPDR